ncbi:hypothetical protein AT251_05515 [Enterovibrio nigricans]|nr:hypothetical protein [Enterovibrio nigricans]PKF51247.1 hypothetical protein AT251_05515 [Enterovibrio nigricans]
MKWAIDLFKVRSNPAGNGNLATFDGTPARVSFYNTCTYGMDWTAENPVWVKKAWREAYLDGHEIGNHTVHHAPGGEKRSEADWYKEIKDCSDFLTRPYNPNESLQSPNASNGIGINPDDLKGFRTPFLKFNDNTFKAMIKAGFSYDVSIEEGFQTNQDGTNHYWPYTLDFGSPGNEERVANGQSEPISTYAGFWSLPVYTFIVPPDNEAEKYGLDYSLRDVAAQKKPYFNKSDGKIKGLDYDLFYEFNLNKKELLATLKYTFDQRLNGNRAPLLLGVHTDMYHDRKTEDAQMRREVFEEFLDYMLSHSEVRIVPFSQIISWMSAPTALDGDVTPHYQITVSVQGHQVDTNVCTEPSWDRLVGYPANSTVSHNGYLWTNNWWSTGEEPGASDWGPWVKGQACQSSTIEYFGTISPNENIFVAENEEQIFVLTPEKGYAVDYVKVNGTTIVLEQTNQFTVGPVTEKTAIEVAFKPIL